MKIMLNRVLDHYTGQKFCLTEHDPPIQNSKVPVDHHKEALHMDSVDLDLMVRPLDREDHQGDMVRVLLVDNLEYIVIF